MSNVTKELVKQLKKDKGFMEAWKANIAMSYMDSYRWYKEKTGKKSMSTEDRHIIANNAADHFLNLLCK